ncbi:adhesion G-protein coupled receptor G2-like [Menidia menidia]
MQRMKFCVWWLVITVLPFCGNTDSGDIPSDNRPFSRSEKRNANCDILQPVFKIDCVTHFVNVLRNGAIDVIIEALQWLDRAMGDPKYNSEKIHVDHFVGIEHTLDPSKDAIVYASASELSTGAPVENVTVKVDVPKVIDDKCPLLLFCTFLLPDKPNWTPMNRLYKRRLVGLKVKFGKISGRVNITMYITDEIEKPQCVFLNFSTTNVSLSSEGCLTLWEPGWNNVTCSCDHLTFFGVLLVSPGDVPLEHLEILNYITLIGCSLSLSGLVISVLLFITNREVRADDSRKVHISLVIALILLNIHLIPSEIVAAMSSPGLCFYMALSLHYSLLATFSWMALEGFHLYLLFVKVFNIYITRYLLKISIVGWGVPAVIVSLVVILQRDAYGVAPLDSSNPKSTSICYITDSVVKVTTTLGIFGLMFLFNVSMFIVIIRFVFGACQRKKSGKNEPGMARKKACTLLTLITLLGITWGLIFFSFGHLTIPGLYIFSILNSLQGFFIFVYFILSWKKIKDSAQSTDACTTNSLQK